MSIENPVIEVNDGIARETTSFTRRVNAAKLPPLADQLEKLRRQLADERPQDFDRRLSHFEMATNGTVGSVPSSGTPLTRNSLGDLLSFIDAPRGALGVLDTLSPAARSAAFNDLKAQYLDRSPEGDRVVRFRTIQLPNTEHRIIRAVTSEKHSGQSGDDTIALKALTALAVPNTTARVVRTFERTDIEVFFPNLKSEPALNDVVHAKLHIVNSEVKKAAFDASFGLFRLVCLNGMTRANEGVSTSVRHMGNIQYKIQHAIESSFAGAEVFFKQFENAYAQPLPGTRSDVLERLEAKLGKQLPSGVFTEAATLWDADGEASAGDTLAGLANALTRAAQAYSYEDADRIELVAGRIVEGTVL